MEFFMLALKVADTAFSDHAQVFLVLFILGDLILLVFLNQGSLFSCGERASATGNVPFSTVSHNVIAH